MIFVFAELMLASLQSQELVLANRINLLTRYGIYVMSNGIFDVSGRWTDPKTPSPYGWGTPESKTLTPYPPIDGRPSFAVSADALMTIEILKGGPNRIIRIYNRKKELKHTLPIFGFELPTVYSLNHIVDHDSFQWWIDGKRVPFPSLRTEPARRSLLMPNAQRRLVVAATNWKDDQDRRQPVTTWMEVWSPQTGWLVVRAPAGFRSVIPLGQNAYGWTPVRLTNDPLTMSSRYALSGVQETRTAPIIAPGSVRFWRNGAFIGANPPNLQVPRQFREQAFEHQHFPRDKFGPLEIYESNVFTYLKESGDPDFFATSSLRFRLHGRWVSIREALPFYRGKDEDLRFHRESGGYLFFEDKGRRELLIAKLPEAWRR